MYQYNYPMASIGVSTFFYYTQNGKTILLMQRRSEHMYHAPLEVAITGGYADAHVKPDGSFETLPQSIRREIGEELGWKFTGDIPQSAFRMDNIAQIRQKFEDKAPSPFNIWQRLYWRILQMISIKPKAKPFEKQMNFVFVWVVKISAETAQKAICFDPNEVAELIHLPIEDVHNVPDIRPWIPQAVVDLQAQGYFK